mgnify:CR=1 FL=1
MTPEAKFWNWMSSRFPANTHIVRIENASSRGTPDVNICLCGQDIWLELKIAKDNGDVLIRKEQRIFGLKRSMAGGKVFCIALAHNELLCCWKYPIETIKKDETYQLITDANCFYAHKDRFDLVLDYLKR